MELSVPVAIQATSEMLSVRAYTSFQQQVAIAQEIRNATSAVERLLDSRTLSELSIRPNPGSWCVAECLHHLTQTTRVFLPAMSAAIAEAPPLAENRRLRTGFLSSLFIRNLRPPYRIRLNVLPQLAPENPDPERAWSDFVESQGELLAALDAAAGLAIDKVTIKSPMYARVNYNIYGAFRMLAAHQSRHVWQMERILKTLDRPPLTAKA